MQPLHPRRLLKICALIFALTVVFSSPGHASGISEIITPHAGSDLESAVLEMKALSDHCGPNAEDYLFANCVQESAWRVQWEPGCYRNFCSGVGYGGQTVYRGAGYIWERVDYQIYRAYGTCSRAGQNSRSMCLGGTWDPATYDKETTYKPDPYAPAAKNAGSCRGICDAMAGNPVNVATGQKYEEALDVSISTPGIPLEFRRSYNGALLNDGPLGYGWTHTYNIVLTVVQSNPLRVSISDTDGRVMYFYQIPRTYTGEARFYGESGTRDRLKKITSTGQYVLRRSGSDLTYTFGTDNKLASITDPMATPLPSPTPRGT